MFNNFVTLGGVFYNADRIESVKEGDGFLHVAISGRAEVSVKTDSPDGVRLKELIATGGREAAFNSVVDASHDNSDHALAFRHINEIVRPDDSTCDISATVRDVETMKAIIDKDTPILREMGRSFGMQIGASTVDVAKIAAAVDKLHSDFNNQVAITNETQRRADEQAHECANGLRILQEKLDKANEDLKAAQALLDGSVDGPTPAQADNILGKPHYNAEGTGQKK